MLPPGLNLPWLRYGGDFGANAWSPAGGLSTRSTDDAQRLLERAARAGARLVRWFVLCDGRAGIRFGPDGMPLALQPVVLDDMACALDLLGAHGLGMMPVLLDFTWADAHRIVNGVALGGRVGVLRDPLARHALWCVVDELVSAFGHHAGIAYWDLWNEPEWLAAPWRPPTRRLGAARVRQLLEELALHVRWHARQPITVGLASTRGLPLVRTLGLDLLQVHWYDPLERGAPLSRRPRVPWSDAPWLLGEYPTRGSTRSPEVIMATAREAGYAAAWPWSLLADDHSSDGEAALRALASSADT